MSALSKPEMTGASDGYRFYEMQTEGAGKMVQAIDEIAKVAEDNAASTEEVSAATEEQSAAMQDMVLASKELAKLSDDLLRIVERFTIGETGNTDV